MLTVRITESHMPRLVKPPKNSKQSRLVKKKDSEIFESYDKSDVRWKLTVEEIELIMAKRRESSSSSGSRSSKPSPVESRVQILDDDEVWKFWGGRGWRGWIFVRTWLSQWFHSCAHIVRIQSYHSYPTLIHPFCVTAWVLEVTTWWHYAACSIARRSRSSLARNLLQAHSLVIILARVTSWCA